MSMHTPYTLQYKNFLTVFLACVAYLLFASGALAQAGEVLCTVYWFIHDDVGRGLATLAVVALGVGALFGKVSWGMAVMVAVGLGALFSAHTITSILTGANCLGLTPLR